MFQLSMTSVIIGLSLLLILCGGSYLASLVMAQTVSPTAPVQQQVQQVQEQVESNSATTDAALAGVGITGAGIAATFVNSFLKGRKLEKEDKRTDKDTGQSLLIRYRLIQAMEAHVPGFKAALDEPFNADTMQKHITIRMKLAEDAQGWATYLMTALNVPPPSMVPNANILFADATNTQPAAPSQATKVDTPETKPVDNTASK